MNWKWTIIIAVILAIVLCPVLLFLGLFLCQRPSVPLVAGGRIVAVARQSFLRPIGRDEWKMVNVYTGKEKIFSMSENILDGGPIFIYPFADGKRFLCDYDDDTAMLDFIVDFGASATNKLSSDEWPLDGYVRTYMASRITNVVFETKGVVRLPNFEELQEVSSYLSSKTPGPTKACYLNYFNRHKSLLLDLATNRQSLWPLTK